MEKSCKPESSLQEIDFNKTQAIGQLHDDDI